MGKTYQSVVINASLDDVWSTIRDFHDFSWAPNVITKCIVVGDLRGDQIGAKRILNDAFHETLLELSDLNHIIRYSIDNGPEPVSQSDVSDYVGELSVRPVTEDNATFVEWSSSWEGSNSQTYDFCHGIYLGLLADLKKKFS